MRATLLLLVLAACSSKEHSPPAKLERTHGEVGTPTCDALVVYERACMAALLPDYMALHDKAMKDFEQAVANLKALFTSKNVADPLGLAESQCVEMLQRQREATAVTDVCPSIALP